MGGDEETIIDENDLYSNDIYAILKTYGVEMARAAILKEVGGVFAAYSIQVDRRHLELIADYMVSGSYQAPVKCANSFRRRLMAGTSLSTARAFPQTRHRCSRRRTRQRWHSWAMPRCTETLTT